jgi:hypothetical protein
MPTESKTTSLTTMTRAGGNDFPLYFYLNDECLVLVINHNEVDESTGTMIKKTLANIIVFQDLREVTATLRHTRNREH